MRLTKAHGIVFGTLALAALALAVQSATEVIINGKVVSSNGRIVDGRLMVPVRDLATSLGYTLTSSGNVVTLTKRAQAGNNATGDDTTFGSAAAPISSGTGTTDSTATPAIQGDIVPGTPGATATPDTTNSIGSTAAPVVPSQNAAGGMPDVAVTTPVSGYLAPTAPSADAYLNPPPPPPPTQITSGIGQDIRFNDLTFKVLDVREGGRSYVERYDQRRDKLTPQWKTDRLVIFDMTVRNNGANALTPLLPGAFTTTVFDSAKVGYTSIGADVQQSSAVNSGSWDDYGMSTPYSGPTLLGPGGSIQFAIVASIPRDRGVGQIVLNLPAPSTQPNSAPTPGMIATVNVGNM